MIRKGETSFTVWFPTPLQEKIVHCDDPNSRNHNCVIPVMAVIITCASPVCAVWKFDTSGSNSGSSYLSIVGEWKGSVKGWTQSQGLALSAQQNIYRALYTWQQTGFKNGKHLKQNEAIWIQKTSFSNKKKKRKKHVYKEPFLVSSICHNPSDSHASPSFLFVFVRFC